MIRLTGPPPPAGSASDGGPAGPEPRAEFSMKRHTVRWLFFHSQLALGLVLLAASPSGAMPGPPAPLRFIGATPANGARVTTATIGVRLDAACSFNVGTLAVTLNGTPIPAGDFLPFSACSNGRITSQLATVPITLPSGNISSGPAAIDAGDTAQFTGSGNGDDLSWNFDGGAVPATGSPAQASFGPAGQFTVRLVATTAEGLAASGLDGGNLVTSNRAFEAGDPTPDTHALAVAMPADIDFINFESSHVHPLALSAAGDELYAVNTPEDRLATFAIAGSGSIGLAGEVPVGVDPVSLAVRPGTSEVWVVNHLSDTVSVVDAAAQKLVATIDTGDEPTDVVFASGRAFVSRSGQEDAVDVYDAATRALLTSIPIFGDDPRALAANAAGTEVYVVVLESGNQTTTLFHELVADGGGPPSPDPNRTAPGQAPDVGLIVQFNPATGDWEDEDGGNWSAEVDFDLPDDDVFIIDADAGTPSVTGTVSGAGTILFDVTVRPSDGSLFVPNIDSRNAVRFEPNLRGHLVETRISVVDPGAGTVNPVDLNPHINYAVTPGPAGEIADSIAHPGDGVFSTTGSYYLTGFGSRKVFEINAANGAVTDRIDVGGGPSGVALNEADGRLYVLNRFENTISTVDTTSNTEIAVIGVAGAALYDPSPDVIKVGRKFLYDGQLTSGHGDTACATCHIFGNFDNLAWDLGNPQGSFLDYNDAPWVNFAPLGPSTNGFDPMKGPMTTQTLRGLEGVEPFHWRGDRENFQAFNPAFIGLMGRDSELSTADMDAYTAFIDTVRFPPNPFRNPDDSMPNSIVVPEQTGGGATTLGFPNTGENLFNNVTLDAGVFTCEVCHANPTGTTTDLFNGQAEGESQDFKIPHMRNMYEKVGFDVIRPGVAGGNANNIGLPQQKAGFGFLHDGALSLTEFLAAGVFNSNDQQEEDVFAFMMAFPTETKPSVGAQVTVEDATKNDAGVIAAIGILIAQAGVPNCDVVAKGFIAGVAKGYVYDAATDLFIPDTIMEDPISEAALRGSLLAGDVLTYTGVPAGAGVRLGIDRDRDGWRDRGERNAGLDPANPNSNPWQWAP